MTLCPCNCKYHRSIDLRTPRMVKLSAFYKRSYAFHTIRERIPIILKNLINDLQKRRDIIAEQFGEESREDIKAAAEELLKLKFEFQTNKSFTYIISDLPDAAIYNDYLYHQEPEDGHTTPFNTIMLFSECYMYRRINACFENKRRLICFDPFSYIKEEAFEFSVPLMRDLAKHIDEGCECVSDHDALVDILKISLWANKFDIALCPSAARISRVSDAKKQEHNILADDSEKIWEALHDPSEEDCVDFVLANAGYELFVDLCLADVLIARNLTQKINFHIEVIPLFVSHVTMADFKWFINQIKNHTDPYLKKLGSIWVDYLQHGVWTVQDNMFWSYPVEYLRMQEYDEELYNKMSKATMIIFKGDYNYRKLFQEVNWDPVMPIARGLGGFLPTKLCMIRILKSGVIIGLDLEGLSKCEKYGDDWAESATYGVIQLCDKIYDENKAEGEEGAEEVEQENQQAAADDAPPEPDA